jgi:hypothetical protein
VGNDAYVLKPRQRTKGLVVRAHGEETLVLDRHRLETVHCLPADVTRVWNACTGTNTLADIATAAGTDEPTAAAAVDQLIERGLIEIPAGADRRKFLQRTALVGAGVAAAAGIQSIVSSPAWAAESRVIAITMAACSPMMSVAQGNIGGFGAMLTDWPAGTYTYTWLLGGVMVPGSIMVTFTVPNTGGTGRGNAVIGPTAKAAIGLDNGATATLTLQIFRGTPAVLQKMASVMVTQLAATSPNGQCIPFGSNPTLSPFSGNPAPATSTPSSGTSSPAPATSTPSTGASSPAPATSPSTTSSP